MDNNQQWTIAIDTSIDKEEWKIVKLFQGSKDKAIKIAGNILGGKLENWREFKQYNFIWGFNSKGIVIIAEDIQKIDRIKGYSKLVNDSLSMEEENFIIKEAGLLGRGMSDEARARDVEESDREYILAKQKKKEPKIYTIRVTRDSSYPASTSPSRISYNSGTLEELIDYYSYTLEVGASWQHEKGNKKINRQPKTIQQLVNNLYNAKNNAAANGYSGYYFEIVPNEENPKYNNTMKESIKIKVLINLLEKYSGKKVYIKESKEEEFLTKDITKYKVGDTFKRNQSSSSPPASWTEVYKVTRVDNTGVYGIYVDTPYFHEYSGEDMR